MSIAASLTDIPHPGEFIKDELDARGWSQRDLSYILGMPEQAVNMIVAGKRGISPEMARALGKAFEVSAEYFANLQMAFEMSRARSPDPGIERRAALQNAYPVREMIKRGWLADTDVGLLETQMMRFLCANDLSRVSEMAHAAKKSDYSETTPIQLAWLYRVRQIAVEMVVAPFSEKRLRALISEMPRYMIDAEGARHVPRALAECGVRYAVVETLPKANIDGVCFWLDETSPVVGMTIRQDRIDNFWFVLRHELEHVIQKDGRGELTVEAVDVDLERNSSASLVSLEEARANAAAADFCVPTADLDSFYARKAPFISERDTLGFAGRVQRHPGIVVGQIQRRMDRYDWLARHKVKVRQFVVENCTTDGWGVPAPVSL